MRTYLSHTLYIYLYHVQEVLAHRIRITDIVSWDKKSYLTYDILRGLSREGCTLVVLEPTRQSRQMTS